MNQLNFKVMKNIKRSLLIGMALLIAGAASAQNFKYVGAETCKSCHNKPDHGAQYDHWIKDPHSQYRHNGFEDNADAHIKRTLMGREVVVAITNGQLDFGTWEQIFYGEFDGKRNKRVLVKIIGE